MFIEQLLFWSAIGFSGGAVVGSFFEWTLHRYIMHRPFFNFTYPFRSHALVHHHTFKSDHTYHVINEADKKIIPMAWWNGPVIVMAGMLPVLAMTLPFGRWDLALGVCLAFSTYYGAYEYMHWCMHLPKKRNIERSGIYFRLNGHHLLHHRYMHKNFNVVFPLADLCLGTLLLRSRIHFKQAEGPSVPNVQPRARKPRPRLARRKATRSPAMLPPNCSTKCAQGWRATCKTRRSLSLISRR